MAAIKGLYAIVQEKNALIGKLRAQSEQPRKQIAALQEQQANLDQAKLVSRR